MLYRLALAGILVIIAAATSRAQPEPPYESPVVGVDRRVTFRISAPNAREVTLAGSLAARIETASKDGAGLWRLVTAPLAPDIYEYAFSIDGVRVLDAQNPWLKFWKTSSNLVEVPGDEPTAYALREVPHGCVHTVRYRSATLGGVARRMTVYTPPGYETAAGLSYPVLYLLHGFGDDDAAWTSTGRAHLALDNAIADGRAVPMIVVMPYGHARYADGTAPDERDPVDNENLRAFRDDLLGDVIPLVERSYRARTGAGDRAIIGLSMGGGQALHIGLGRPDLFAWVGAFSSAVYGSGHANAFPLVESSPRDVDLALRWLWIGCGREDFLFDTDTKLSAWLTEKGVAHRFEITGGGHSWSLWRGDYLPRVVPLLFRPGSRLSRGRLYDALDTDKYLGEARVAATVDDARVFTEGPAVDRAGALYFTNIPVAKILRLDPETSELSVHRRDSNDTNGLLFDAEGRLLACEGGAGRVTRSDSRSAGIEVLASQFNGFPLAAPNDLTIDGSGRIWFTSRPGGPDPSKSNVNAVYRIDPDASLAQVLAWPRIHMPNGIATSPDEKTLYLIEAHPDADHHRDIRAFDLGPGGELSGERVLFDFYPGRSGDGMAVDCEGNLYVAAGLWATRRTSETLETRPGIHVISPKGELLAFRETPEDTVTNCTFGGADLRTLWVTCGTKIIAIPTAIPGKPSYRPER